MSIKISVVIPTFKRSQLLIKCLTALKEQNFLKEQYEIIVITDGPDEATINETAAFIEKNPSPVIICASLVQKGGPAAARNKGAVMARGELIAFTDDDCVPHTNWLKKYWDAWCHEQKNEMAFTGKTIVPHNYNPTDYEKNIAHLEKAEFITANCACTKQAFKKAGGFDEEFTIAWREDSDLHFKLINASVPVLKVEDAVITHPVRNAPWGISLKEQKKSKYNALLCKKHPLLYKQKIGARPLYNYYGIVILLPVAILSYYYKKPAVTFIAVLSWIVLVTLFITKRLTGTTKNPRHIVEMIATSILIPFLSVFWTLYGSFRYKKLLL